MSVSTLTGWTSWEDVLTEFADGGYKMTYSGNVGSVMLGMMQSRLILPHDLLVSEQEPEQHY